MFPVLAEQELQAIELIRRHHLAHAERGRQARASASGAHGTKTTMSPPRAGVRSWFRAVGDWAVAGHRPAPEVGEGISGASV